MNLNVGGLEFNLPSTERRTRNEGPLKGPSDNSLSWFLISRHDLGIRNKCPLGLRPAGMTEGDMEQENERATLRVAVGSDSTES